VPPAIVRRKGVDLIHDDNAEILEQGDSILAARDEHYFERFRRRQQTVRRLSHEPTAGGGSDITMPQRHSAAYEPAEPFETLVKVVQERSKRADVQD
jgi:hypothetical protein